MRIAKQLHLDVPRPLISRSKYTRSSPNDDRASERAIVMALFSSSADRTTRMPFPPPPDTAFTSIGYSTSSEVSPPGITGTPAVFATSRAFVLLPISRIAAAVGPMNVSFAFAQASANSGFSARNP